MNRCPRTWFSTEFHTGKRLLRARLNDLLTAPRRRGVLPILLTLLCVGTFGTIVACVPAVEETSEHLQYEEVDLSALWQQNWGAGEPLSITAEERADYAALLREKMDAAYTVLCDCLGYTPAAQTQGEPRYDDQGRAWYPFSKYASVAEVRSAVDAAFSDEHRMDKYLDPDDDPWLMDLDGGLWWREDAYMDGGTFLPPATYCFDSLALLARTEDRLDFALVGLGNYYDAPLEWFTLVREGDAWKLEEYGEQVTYLTDDLPGALWLNTIRLWEELARDTALAAVRVERLIRYADQINEAGDRFQIYRFSPVYTLAQVPDEELSDSLMADGLTCRPASDPYLIFLEGEDGPVCLGRLTGDAGTPGDASFSDHLDLLLARWKGMDPGSNLYLQSLQ